MIGQTISHYRIIEKIAEGGMGVVYKAEDIKLGRFVALKFPSDQILADQIKKERFFHEARAAAALDHPNICTLHEIDEAQGKTFISMAYIEGRTLHERVKSGPLPVAEALEIAIQIAQGLEEAHQKGIVHRDVKSANIMVTPSGHTKIMDFGLAKLADETRLTRFGAIMGTVDYMSPEQARGDPIDHRTDIWSLGVVMYEMLTAQLPFKGGTEQAVVHAILHEEPARLRHSRPDASVALEQIVLKMICKEPSHRPDSMKAVIENLEFLRSRPNRSDDATSRRKPVIKAAGIVAVVLAVVSLAVLIYLRPWAAQSDSIPSIAVLPFEDMSQEKDQEYFCDGIAEELIGALTQVEGLRVIHRDSAFSYKGKNASFKDIAGDLGVRTILTGTVQKEGERLRISASLVDPATGYNLWSDRYDRRKGDLFAIQDEITLAIIEKLKPRLLGQEKARLAKREIVKEEAHNLYLKGMHYWHKRGFDNLSVAITHFTEATNQDPNYARAYAGLASSYSLQPVYRPAPRADFYMKAKMYAEKALNLDDTSAEAHAAMGFIKGWHEWDWQGADRHYKLAMKYNPGYAHAHHWYSQSLYFRGRFEQAVEEMEEALKRDPLSPVINKDLAAACCLAGQFERTITIANRALEMNPAMQFCHYHIALAHFKQGMFDQALKGFQKEKAISPEAPQLTDAMIVATYVRMGKPDKARLALNGLVEYDGYVSPACLAYSYLALGEYTEGFALLEKAYDERDFWLCVLKLIEVGEEARSQPRFVEMLKRLNLDE